MKKNEDFVKVPIDQYYMYYKWVSEENTPKVKKKQTEAGGIVIKSKVSVGFTVLARKNLKNDTYEMRKTEIERYNSHKSANAAK